MHRLTNTGALFLLLALGGAAYGCGGGNKKAESPADGEKADDRKNETPGDGFDSEKGDAGAAAAPAPKKDACVAAEGTNIEDLLAKSDCEVPNTKPEGISAADMKAKLEVKLTASPTKAAPGGKVDLFVAFTNKRKDPLPLQFRIDPVARFETETYDDKAKRADMPAGKPPPPPKGHTPPPPAEAKVGKVMVAPNGTVRVRVPWEAVKMKWAPEKVRGTAAERGYPRSPSGPLKKGKYTVKVVTPLLGVQEGGEHEVTAPKVDIEVAP